MDELTFNWKILLVLKGLNKTIALCTVSLMSKHKDMGDIDLSEKQRRYAFYAVSYSWQILFIIQCVSRMLINLIY